MLFTTLTWALFLLCALAVFHLVPTAWRRWTMLASSIVFYASWSVPFLALIGGQLVVDWTCGALLGRTDAPGRRRLILCLSLAVNLSVLAVF